MDKTYFACVYGGANEKISDSIKDEIHKLGNIIAEGGFSLVYGAGSTGSMGAVARGTREKGGFIKGVVPHFIKNKFESTFDCDELIMVDDMAERKLIMEKEADIFFIAPGGIGTFDEFFQILTLRYLEQITTPIVILNLEGFYDSLLSFIDDNIKKGASSENIKTLFDVVTSADDVRITNYLNVIKEQ